jgi:hypothetical protein
LIASRSTIASSRACSAFGLLGNDGARRVLLRSCQQHAGAIDQPVGTRGDSIDGAAVLFEQRDHPLIALPMRLHDRCAAGVDIRVRVGATLQQQCGNLVSTRRGALPQRHAPGAELPSRSTWTRSASEPRHRSQEGNRHDLPPAFVPQDAWRW